MFIPDFLSSEGNQEMKKEKTVFSKVFNLFIRRLLMKFYPSITTIHILGLRILLIKILHTL